MRNSPSQFDLGAGSGPDLSPGLTGAPRVSRPRTGAILSAHARRIGEASLVAVLWSVGLGSGLSADAGRTSESAGQTLSLVWPPPPAEPRLAYVESISRPSDAGVKRSALGRFAKWITGSDKGNEMLSRPFGIAIDEDENLCLTDTGANTVCYLNRAKKKWQRWDKIGSLRFSSPVAVACRKETFYVADSGLGAVVVFNVKGRLLFTMTNQIERPSGLAITGEQLFVADSQRHRIVEFDLTGRYRSEFGHRGSGEGQFNFPTHIAADAQGDLFVTDSMNHRILRFDRRGRFKNQIGSGGNRPGYFGRPKGVAVDSFGHVYVMDALFDMLQVFDREGRFLLNVGHPGSGPGQFWLPGGIAITSKNEIFVADSYNQRIQVFQYIGQP